MALSLAGWAGLPLVWLAAIAVPPLHLYRQLRASYALSRRAVATGGADDGVHRELLTFTLAVVSLAVS